MPYNFSLPTTSDISYTHFFQSSTHPSLPVTASTYRAAVQNVLKAHKRLPIPSQAAHLPEVLSALEEYLPYLLTLDAGLAGQKINGEEVDITLRKEVVVEWRSPALTAGMIPGREATRPKGRGLDYEICFVLSTLAYIHTLLAHSQLRALYAPTTPTQELRTGIITKSTRYLLQANSIHAYLTSRANEISSSSFIIPAASAAMETSPLAQEALAELAMAEATLLAVLKDDPYPAIVAQDRNSHDTEWKFKAPEIPRIRAPIFARLCLAAAAHAAKAELLLNSFRSSSTTRQQTVMIRRQARGDDGSAKLLKYIHDLVLTARAKAYRFFGIVADLGGEQGQGIAWLRAAKRELGFGILMIGGSGDGSQGGGGSGRMKVKGGFAKFKKEWTERREDKRIEKGEGWGGDAGRLEEGRIVDMLEKKWNKINDIVSCSNCFPPSPLTSIPLSSFFSALCLPSTPPFFMYFSSHQLRSDNARPNERELSQINTQLIPPFDGLVANTPSGREFHSTIQLLLPCLGGDVLERMRAPPDIDSDDDDDGDENDENDEDEDDDDDNDDNDEVDSDDDDDDHDDSGLDAVGKDKNDGSDGDVNGSGESNGKRRIVERNRGGYVASLV